MTTLSVPPRPCKSTSWSSGGWLGDDDYIESVVGKGSGGGGGSSGLAPWGMRTLAAPVDSIVIGKGQGNRCRRHCCCLHHRPPPPPPPTTFCCRLPPLLIVKCTPPMQPTIIVQHCPHRQTLTTLLLCSKMHTIWMCYYALAVAATTQTIISNCHHMLNVIQHVVVIVNY